MILCAKLKTLAFNFNLLWNKNKISWAPSLSCGRATILTVCEPSSSTGSKPRSGTPRYYRKKVQNILKLKAIFLIKKIWKMSELVKLKWKKLNDPVNPFRAGEHQAIQELNINLYTFIFLNWLRLKWSTYFYEGKRSIPNSDFQKYFHAQGLRLIGKQVIRQNFKIKQLMKILPKKFWPWSNTYCVFDRTYRARKAFCGPSFP